MTIGTNQNICIGFYDSEGLTQPLCFVYPCVFPCPHGFESLLFSYENKKTSQWMSFCFGAVEGIRTPMVSHTDLNRARLPIPPRPRIGCSESVKHFRLSNIQYYTTSSAQLQRKDSQNAGKIAENAPRSFTKPSGITPIR